MPKVRQDAWSHEDDLLLAETVLRHIREGGTQLKAFEEVGDLLNRTSAACGFRWNAEVRQKYEQAVELAKKQRKEKKRKEANQQPSYDYRTPITYKTEPTPHVPTYYEEQPQTKEQSAQERPQAQESQVQQNSDIQLPQVIRFLENLQSESTHSESVKQQLKNLEDENRELIEKNKQLNRKLESMSEDYQALIQIMDRARKMVLFDEEDHSFKPQFRMEKNGNLENVAR